MAVATKPDEFVTGIKGDGGGLGGDGDSRDRAKGWDGWGAKSGGFVGVEDRVALIADGEESRAVGLADGDSVDGGGEAGDIGEASTESIDSEFLAVEGGGAVDWFVEGFTWERADCDDEEIAAATDAVFEEVGDAGGESLAEGKWEQGFDGGFWV